MAALRPLSRLIKKKRLDQGDMNLQITSLADILIIVLIFLIKTVSSGLDSAENISVSGDVRLPIAEANGQAKQGLKVEIANGKIDVGGRKIASLNGFRFTLEDLNEDLSDNGTAKSMNAEFKRAREEAQAGKAPSTVWIVADARAPYATIQTVIASAAASGFTDFKLAVTKGE
jgi:biopolymer transport protein ExbD